MKVSSFGTNHDPTGLVLPAFGERQSLRQQVTHALRAALVAVTTGHTCMPSRCNGKSAALLPAWP